MVNWSALPDLAVVAIGDRLPFSVDYVRFRSVCSSWRSAAPRRLLLPWLAVHRCPDDDTYLPNVFSFSVLSIPGPTLRPLPLPPASPGSHCCGVSNGWLALLDRTPAVSLFNPLTGARIHLPPFTSIPGDINSEISKLADGYISSDIDYGSDYSSDYGSDDNYIRARDYMYTQRETGLAFRATFEEVAKHIASTVVLSADPAATSDCIVLALRGCWKNIEFCRLGDDSWKPVGELDLSFCQVDVEFYQGQFYVVHEHTIFSCSIGPSEAVLVKIPVIEPSFDEYPSLRSFSERYLVEAGGDLLLVGLNCRRENYIAYIFRVDFQGEKLKLVKLKSLGDYTLFVGQNQSFSLQASKFPGLKANRIYMAQDYLNSETRIRVIDPDDCNYETCSNELLLFELPSTGSQWRPCSWFWPSLLE